MNLDTEKDELQLTITLHDAFELLAGRTVSEKTWKHLCGVLGEWYGDIYVTRLGDPKEKIEENKKNYYSVKYCCERFENMHDTRRIIINSDDSTYNIIDFQERLIKGDCTHCMFCGTKLQAERL